MTFAHPWWLVLIAPAVALAALDATRRWPTVRHRVAAIAARAAIIVALAGAASEPSCVRSHRAATVVFLLDRSGSMGDAALERAWNDASRLRGQLDDGTRAALVAFDHHAEVLIAPGEAWRKPAALRTPGPAADATDIAGAIRLGAGLVPPGHAGHLVMIGDGRGNAGDLRAAIAAAGARKISVSAVPSIAVEGDPAIAEIAIDDGSLRPGATLTGKIEIDAGGVNGHGRVTVKVGGEVALTTEVTLSGGRTSVPLSYGLPPKLLPGVVPITAELALDPGVADGEPRNDLAAAPLVIDRPPHIVILDGDKDGAAPLAKVLRAEQMNVTVVDASKNGPPPDLEDADLVILANAPVRAGLNQGVIDDDVGEALVKWVDDGGGMLVLGGPSSLNGFWAANRIADALPVELEPIDPEVDQAATVVVILDQSGSMGEMVGGRTKLALAAEGGAAVIRLLRSFDRVAVMAVEDRVNWLVKPRTIGGDSAMLERKTRNVPVGGDGIFVYTSLVAAKKVLDQSSTPLKHVILFSDTFDAAEQVRGIDYGDFHGWPSGRANSFDVAKQIKNSGATLSVIGVGWGQDRKFSFGSYFDDDDDSDFLKQLAAEGGGRYYRTADAKQLRALFVQDAQRLLDNDAREEDIQLKAVGRHPSLDGVDLGKAPPLHGYQEVKPRPAAQVVLTDGDAGHPILVRWPYGLGEVAVWSSDAGPRWAKSWAKWPGYDRFWTQLVRSSLRRHEGDAIAVEVEYAGTSATVRVVERGNDPGALTARITDSVGGTSGVPATPGAPAPGPAAPASGARALPMRVVEPGVHQATLPLAADGFAMLEVLDRKGKVVAHRTLVHPAPVEMRHRGPDVAALTALATATGGTVDPRRVVLAGGPTTTRSTPLAVWLLLLALALLPVDATLRRAARLRR